MNKTRPDISLLETKARQLRATCIKMSHEGREGHLGGSLSCIDILVALYHYWLEVSPEDHKALTRDRFFFSKGHACSALYAVLADRGLIPKEWLSAYNQPGSPLHLHPCKNALPALEMSAGSLGHGLGVACGAVYGLRMDGVKTRAVVLMSDGECNEGSVWEAAMFARAQRLDNLLAIVDYNGTQSIGMADEVMGHTSLEEKFRSFGWAARTVNGNDIAALIAVLDGVPFVEGQPSAIIAKTRKGVSFMEDQILWHYRVPPKDEMERAILELGASPIY